MTPKSSLLATATLGVLFAVLGVSCGSTSLRGKDDFNATLEIKYISLQEITTIMEATLDKEVLEGTVDEGLRMLQCSKQITCERGGDEDYHITMGDRDWGSCQNMDHCLCGVAPLSMSFWCPKQCRPGCGGSCATPQECPDGFNIENGVVTPYTGELPPPPYTYWPCNLGPACTWYANPGAPTLAPVASTTTTPFPTPAPVVSSTTVPPIAPTTEAPAVVASSSPPTPMPVVEDCELPPIWC